ncbi:protein phosphatase 2C domain-containing protein [Microbacterium sp. NPDC079995]|uniref:PP2C family protein-serine/threonine phosphatase n=1 Tax=unclassified Microbacterium TaxID=2609290 RepID=UPI00344D3C6F
MRIHAGVRSDVGGYRDVNQDAAFASPFAAAVADGVGGGPSGDLASAAIIHKLITLRGALPSAAELIERLKAANWDIGAHIRRDAALAGMASTLTGVWLTAGEELIVAHTGDSRAYLLRDGGFVRQTRDDSFVQALVDRGLVRPEDAWTHPRRNVITASFGGNDEDVIRVETRDVRAGDRWFLCSDGVTDYLPEDALAEVLHGETDPVRAAHAVVELALEAASRDNVTAVVCDVVGDQPDATVVPVIAGAAASRWTEVIEAGLASA